MNAELKKHPPNGWWDAEDWIFQHVRILLAGTIVAMLLAYAALMGAPWLRVVVPIGIPIAVWAVVKFVGFMAKDPPSWTITTKGYHFNLKVERRNLADLHRRLPSTTLFWLEETTLYFRKGEDESPLAAVLWLVLRDDNNPNRTVRRGIRIWTGAEPKQAVKPASY